MKREYQFWVYIVSNKCRTVLYTGVTSDLDKRVFEHANGEGGKFSEKYRTTELVWFEEFEDIRDAIDREKEIKSWRREKKDALIRSLNPNLIDLARH